MKLIKKIPYAKGEMTVIGNIDRYRGRSFGTVIYRDQFDEIERIEFHLGRRIVKWIRVDFETLAIYEDTLYEDNFPV